MKPSVKVAVPGFVFVLSLTAVSLYANVMLRFSPELGGGVPAYARIERLGTGEALVHTDGTWAAITFYREPEGVPPDFDLLGFSDAPRAFDDPLTTEGFEIWRIAPWEEGADQSPLQVVSYGLGAVPIWFVRLEELQGAIADDCLTIGELEALPSLKVGSAVYFKETLHPTPGRDVQQTKTQIVARGTLEGGGSFFYQAEETHNHIKHVKIEF